MPNDAATPVPTITAVGVAKPKAQGQAITKVDIPKLKAKLNLVSPSEIKSSEYVNVYTNINQVNHVKAVSNRMHGIKT